MLEAGPLGRERARCVRSILAGILGCQVFNGMFLRAADARIVLEPFTLVAFYTTRRRRRQLLFAVGYGDLETFEKLAAKEGATHLVWPRVGGRCPEGYEPWRCACMKRRVAP